MNYSITILAFIADADMWSDLKMASTQFLIFCSCVVKFHGSMRVQIFSSKFAFEASDEVVIGRCAGT